MSSTEDKDVSVWDAIATSPKEARVMQWKSRVFLGIQKVLRHKDLNA